MVSYGVVKFLVNHNHSTNELQHFFVFLSRSLAAFLATPYQEIQNEEEVLFERIDLDEALFQFLGRGC